MHVSLGKKTPTIRHVLTAMKSPALWSPRFFQRFVLFLIAFAFIGTFLPLSAAPGARKLLKMELSKDRRAAVVQVPAGFSSVTLQRFNREGGWRKVAVKKVDSTEVKFKLPTAPEDVRWRAIGRFESGKASHGKFPTAFYKGENSFGPLKNRNSGTGIGLPNIKIFREMTVSGDVVAGEVPEEADIWQTDGGTVYFFNQLRGLQVLDVSNPSDPRITGSLRLPAVGEDLYLLPGAGSVRHLVLLTQKNGDEGTMTRINLVKVEAGKVEITHRQDVPGFLSDSRMVGNRLILATTSWTMGVSVAGDGTEEVSSSSISQWIISPGLAPQAVGAFPILGDYPLISAGADWLTVAVTPPGEWGFSEVTVFGLDHSGLTLLTPSPIRTVGVIADKFKLSWRDNILTTISEQYRSERDWTPTTVLENFRVWGAGVVHTMVVEGDFGKLQLAKGESLYATRFDGDKAYIVTFLQTDPLWIVDLSDPKKPVISGHLEVPGWSSYLEPMGDLLLSVGWESDTVAASLFDVADPAAPKLLRRLNLGSPGAYSEATWDEQALKVLPDAGLVMIPLTSYDIESGEPKSVVQLLDLDTSARDLTLRGSIAHEFDARRSELIGDAVVSISQRVMVAADVSDRDKPQILSEVSLAWPVDRVIEAGTHLLQIEAGSGYGQSRATVRVSAANAPEAVFSETDLGKGTVWGADFREGKLFILREIASGQSMFYRSPVTGSLSGKLVLSVYDASALPALTWLGSVSTSLKPGMKVAGSGLVWPQANRPSVVLDALSSFWYWDAPIVIDEPILMKKSIEPGSKIAVDRFPFWRSRKAPQVVAFDTTRSDFPLVSEPVVVGTLETIPNGVYDAADGLIVIGAGNWKNEANGESLPVGKVIQSVHVIEVAVSGDPVVRPGIDLPGELFVVSELDQDGFLAFTRNFDSGEEPAVKVSACDGYDAFEIASLVESPNLVATAGGRRLFIAKKGGVDRQLLTDSGAFIAEEKLDIGWKPQQLRWIDGILLGSKWNALFAAEADAKVASKWRFPTWSLTLEHVAVAADGDILAPFGEYGAERLNR